MTPSQRSASLVLPPILRTAQSLTGYCLSRATYEHIENTWAAYTLLKHLDGRVVDQVFKEFYAGMPLGTLGTYEGDEYPQAQVLRELLAIVEFVYGACTVYRTHRNQPARMALGVVHERYRKSSAIALLEPVDVENYFWSLQGWAQFREQNHAKGFKEESFRYTLSETFSSGIWPLLKAMAKTQFRSVKPADRNLWQLV